MSDVSEFKKALRHLRKYRRWHKGKIDDWSKTHHVPPVSVMNFILDKSEEALQQVIKFQSQF